MKPLRFLLASIFLAALLSVPGVSLLIEQSHGSAAAQENIDVSYFYDELAYYGEWVWHPRFGYVWLPQDVSDDWRPYTVGHWLYTDKYGWYWRSEEPFAWAVYHYGRWGYDTDYGWFWVPGDVWAPAWVTWRYSDSYAGWAPIAPHNEGYAYGVPAVYESPVAEAWFFVEHEYLFVENVYDYAVPVPEINVVFLQTTTIYHPEFQGDLIFNVGIPYRHLEGILNRPVPTYSVIEVQEPRAAQGWSDRDNKPLPIFAPRLNKAAPHRPPKQFAKTPFEANPKAKLKADRDEGRQFARERDRNEGRHGERDHDEGRQFARERDRNEGRHGAANESHRDGERKGATKDRDRNDKPGQKRKREAGKDDAEE
jgi:hypothetical protein